jgi:hypothetical protein
MQKNRAFSISSEISKITSDIFGVMKLKFIHISAACVQETTQGGWYVQTSKPIT